jgi:hypothetical protein
MLLRHALPDATDNQDLEASQGCSLDPAITEGHAQRESLTVSEFVDG